MDMRKKDVKKIISAVVVLIMCSILAACSGQSYGDSWVPAGMQLASGTDASYKLYVPNAWTVDTSTGLTTASTNSGNISFYPQKLEDSSTSLTEYWEAYSDALQKSFSELTYETEGENILLDGSVPGLKYVYTAKLSDVSYKFMQVIAIREGYVYIFTYTSTEENYQQCLEDAESIVSHIMFDD